ncbi:cupin domain-containing protein [Nocardia amamiensis]|uniref:cupin domain-containing protein n=1 Tax=Nocardia amamiensis TaxID=404578 RepID=UPI000A0348EA|nr:cupin domain-containing protein [Nocardia amamiensis]
MKSAVKQVRVISPSDSAETIGRQRQRLVPCVTTETCGATGISAGMVNMAPAAVSRAHYHAHSEIVVVCLRGSAVTLVGPDLTPYFHGPGEFIYIPDGVVHVAVNLADADDLVALEMRTDPLFNDDVVLTPEYDARVPEVVARLRRDLTGS